MKEDTTKTRLEDKSRVVAITCIQEILEFSVQTDAVLQPIHSTKRHYGLSWTMWEQKSMATADIFENIKCILKSKQIDKVQFPPTTFCLQIESPWKKDYPAPCHMYT